SGMSAQTYQGKTRFSEASNFEAAIKALTPESTGFAIVHPGRRSSKGQIEVGTMEIKTELYVCLPKDTSTTVDTTWSFAESIANVVQQEMAYYGLACRPI